MLFFDPIGQVSLSSVRCRSVIEKKSTLTKVRGTP